MPAQPTPDNYMHFKVNDHSNAVVSSMAVPLLHEVGRLRHWPTGENFTIRYAALYPDNGKLFTLDSKVNQFELRMSSFNLIDDICDAAEVKLQAYMVGHMLHRFRFDDPGKVHEWRVKRSILVVRDGKLEDWIAPQDRMPGHTTEKAGDVL